MNGIEQIIGGEICLEGQKASHLLEIQEISDILNNISDTSIDDEFSINNNGINYKLGNDSKIISKIYEIIIIDKLKGLLDTKGYKYIENEIQNKYPDFIIISKHKKKNFMRLILKVHI